MKLGYYRLLKKKKKKRREVGTTVPRIFLILLLNIKSIPITVDALFWVLGFVLQAQSGTIANNCPRVVRSGLDIQIIRVLQGHLLPITNSYPQNGAQHKKVTSFFSPKFVVFVLSTVL